jgi:4-amino-4-deoxy-L-arabinose transferase-like glycosyltransferase
MFNSSLVKKIIIFSLILLPITYFFSFQILKVPTGLTGDEAAFGYNATLLAKTAHDENGRFMPIFVNSIEGRDWRQPFTQYYLTALFKIFGPSIFLLRFSSVLITVFSALLLYLFATTFTTKKYALIASLIFLTTPLIMIQSHLGLDNIMPIPFTIVWLIALYQFGKTKNKKMLILAGLTLGFNFYTYKAMRAVVPIWSILTLGYVFILNPKLNKFISPAKFFILAILPFFLIIPILEHYYAGAIFDRHTVDGQIFNNIYDLIYPYLSSFDLSFLFIKGDSTYYHSDQIHGMFLLASLPLFLTGIYYSAKKNNFTRLLLAAFFLSPLLFGLVGSVHRASRLMNLIPIYSIISMYGAIYIQEKLKISSLKRKIIIFTISLLMFLNFVDFIKYYWYTYPVIAKTNKAFEELDQYISYKELANKAQELNLTPYISSDLYEGDGENGHFFEAMYFKKIPQKWGNNDIPPPTGSIFMSKREDIPSMEKLDVNLPYYYLHIIK